MKIIRELVEKKRFEQKELLEKLNELQERRDELRKEGDLKEKEEYHSTLNEIGSVCDSISKNEMYLQEAEPVDIRTSFDRIEEGCKFSLKIKHNGDRLKGKKHFTINGREFIYNKETNTTTVSQTVIMGGPEITDLELSILASDSPLGKELYGKTFGIFSMKDTSHEEQVVIVSQVTEL